MQVPIHQISVHKCLIAIGGNQPSSAGTSLDTLKSALDKFGNESLQIRKMSNWYQTPAFPADSGPDFVNAAVAIETRLSPDLALKALHRIEHELGRTRDDRWEPRVCDLDLISYNDIIAPDLETYTHWQSLDFSSQTTLTPPELILPHPRVQDRAFVLVPLKDVAPNWCHPVSKLSIQEMLSQLPQQDIKDISVLPD